MSKTLDVTVVIPGGPTVKGENGSIVRMAMDEDKIRGNSSNYVIIDGSSIITSFGKYFVTSRLNDERVDARNVDGDGEIDPNRERSVVHRRRLWRHLGADEARKFWRFGRRTRR